MEDVIVTGFSNVTKEGVLLRLNKPARLKSRNGVGARFQEIWVSWDKIGESLFEGYTDKSQVDDRDKLRVG